MLTRLASLGLGLITALGASAASAHEACDPAHQGASTSSYGYGPAAPAYAPGYASAAPPYAPPYAPPPPVHTRDPRAVQASVLELLRQADYNRDGWVTRGEMEAFGRVTFARSDRDRNGVLTGYELRRGGDPLVLAAFGGDGVVRFGDYEASLGREFQKLDRNRDGLLSGYELGTQGRPGVGWRFRWSS